MPRLSPARCTSFRSLPVALAGLALGACAGRVPPPPDGVPEGQNYVSYYVRVARPGADRFEVTLAADRIRADSLDFVLPAWMPGRYGIGSGRAVVENFAARDDRGEPIAMRRLDFSRWRLYPERPGYITVGYRVVPGSSSEPLPFRTQIDLHSGYAVGAGLFGYLAGFEHRPVTVSFDAPPGWRVVTPLLAAGANRFAARSYADLPATRIVMGDRIRDYKLFVQGRPHQVTVQGAGPEFVPDSLLRLVNETIDLGTRFLGRPAYERYVFAVHFASPAVSGFGATGYAAGSSYFLPTLDAERLRDAGIGQLLLHQYLHAWIPGRFGPTQMVRPSWTRTPSLEGYWFVEGAAEYYAQLLPVRYGGPGRQAFYDSMGRLLTAWYDLGGGDRIDPQALSAVARRESDEQSLRRLLVGGALATFLVDLTLLEETRGLRGLDQAIYYLQRSVPPEGYDPVSIWHEISAALGVPASVLGPLTGTGALSIDAGLSRAGLRAVARSDADRLGARLEPSAGGRFVVADLERGGTAARAGLREGDRLLKIGSTPVGPDEVVATRFALSRYIRNAPTGAPVTFEVERDGQVRELTGTVREVRRTRTVISEDPLATPTAMLVRSSLFRPALPVPGDR